MRERIRELRQKRANLVRQAREILDRAEQEKRSLSADEEQQYQNIMSEVENLRKQIEREEELAALEDEMRGNSPGNEPHRPNPAGTTDTRQNPRATEEYRSAFRRYLRDGLSGITADELRAMQADNDAGGGYLVAPQQFVNELLANVTEDTPFRKFARVFTLTTAASLGVPTLDRSQDDAEWTAELAIGGETEVKFGKRELRPHPLSKEAKISNKLLRVAAMDAEEIVRQELARIFGETMEKAYMTGDGVAKPLGIFKASKDGISTARDVASKKDANTIITFDGLKAAKYKLHQKYWRNARWLFHIDSIAEIAKIKDADGRYIWTDSVVDGEPDRLLGFPILISNFVPNDTADGKYIGALADLSKYWIADALDMQIQRLVEAHYKTNQTGFVGRLESDGMPVLEEAFVRIKVG
jgi:HK97 family phage major capsid protein